MSAATVSHAAGLELAARCLLSKVGVTPLESVWACTAEWARHRGTLTAFQLAYRYLLDVEDRLHEMREEARDAARAAGEGGR